MGSGWVLFMVLLETQASSLLGYSSSSFNAEAAKEVHKKIEDLAPGRVPWYRRVRFEDPPLVSDESDDPPRGKGEHVVPKIILDSSVLVMHGMGGGLASLSVVLGKSGSFDEEHDALVVLAQQLTP